MKRKFLAGIFLLSILPLAVCKTYAWGPGNQPPVAVVFPHERTVCVEQFFLLDGTASHDWDGEVVWWGWCSSDCNCYGYSDWICGNPPECSEAYCKFSAPGVYWIDLWVRDNEGAECTFPDYCVVTVIKVDIISADVTKDKIHIELEGGQTGLLKLELVNPNYHLIRQVVRSAGEYYETFNIPNLAKGEYKRVKATWTPGGISCSDEYNYHIKVLGEYDHTCYNTPDESQCSGSYQWFSYTVGDCINTDCVWDNAPGKSQWLDCITNPQYGTGSGQGENGHIYVQEWYCTGNQYSPKLRRTGQTCPYCGGSLSSGDVAINPNHSDLGCGNRVFVYQHGVHTVRDHGGGVNIDQLDHYHGVSGCFDCPSIGNDIMTVKLY